MPPTQTLVTLSKCKGVWSEKIMECCDTKKKDFDLLIIGSGSAAFAAAIKATELGKSVGMIEKGTLGGTCVNVGCVPSKTLIRAAETKHRIETSRFAGILPGRAEVNFGEVIAAKNKLVNKLREAKYQSILSENNLISLIQGEARFLDQETIEVSGRILTAEKFLICTGSSEYIPLIPGLKESGYLTSTTAFELERLPKTLVILGGGYIALEAAQMFRRLGSEVTLIQRSKILSHEDDDVSGWMVRYLSDEGIRILGQTEVREVKRTSAGIKLSLFAEGCDSTLDVEHLLVATGRRANTANLNLTGAGVALTKTGAISVNEFCQSTRESIYAAGDVTPSPALVYVAAYEGNLAAENAFTGNRRKADYTVVPWVIFSDPQVAGVGLNEREAIANGIEYDVSFMEMNDVPRAIAARDTRGFIKLLKRKGSDHLIGARVVAPEGSELIMELSLMIRYKIPVSDIASMLHPYLTLSEAVKLAAQGFEKDVKKLSCCAS